MVLLGSIAALCRTQVVPAGFGMTRLDARLYQHARYVMGPLRGLDDRHNNIL